MIRVMSALGIGLVLLLATGRPAFSTIDTEGTGCKSITVSIPAPGLVSASVSPSKSVYTFEGKSQINQIECGNDEIGWDVGNAFVLLSASGTWDATTKVAEEVIDVNVIGGPAGWEGIFGGKSWIKTTMTCPADPWLNNVQCMVTAQSNKLPQTISGQPVVQPPFPKTAGAIPEVKKNALKEDAAQYKAPFEFASVTILSPAPGQTFYGDVKLQVEMSVYGLQSSKVELAFQLLHVPGGWVSKWVPPLSEIDVKASPQGVTVPFAKFGEKGKWRVQARVALPGASWSNWREFAITDAPQPQKLEFQPGAGQKPSDRPSPGTGAGPEQRVIQPPPLQMQPVPVPGPRPAEQQPPTRSAPTRELIVPPGIQPQPVPTQAPGPVQRQPSTHPAPSPGSAEPRGIIGPQFVPAPEPGPVQRR